MKVPARAKSVPVSKHRVLIMLGAVLVATATTVAAFVALTLWVKPTPAVEDRLRLALLIVGAIGVVLGGVYAYRKQVLAEYDSDRTDRNRLDELFSAALDQLGHEAAAIRLGGV